MNAQQLVARFPQIPQIVYGHPVLEQLASTFGEYLQTAHKPSNCSSNQLTRDHHVYMKLIAPLEVLQYGFIKPETNLAKLEGYIAAYQADRDAFLAEMIPPSAAPVPGGCQGPDGDAGPPAG